jgi:hypothetical protein
MFVCLLVEREYDPFPEFVCDQLTYPCSYRVVYICVFIPRSQRSLCSGLAIRSWRPNGTPVHVTTASPSANHRLHVPATIAPFISIQRNSQMSRYGRNNREPDRTLGRSLRRQSCPASLITHLIPRLYCRHRNTEQSVASRDTPCSLLDAYRRFNGTHYFHLQG